MNQNAHAAKAKISAITTFTCAVEEVNTRLNTFLKSSNLHLPDLILYGNSFLNSEKSPLNDMNVSVINYSDFSGVYMTNAAFGLQMATEILSESSQYQAEKILIINNFRNTDFGFIYLEKA